MKKRFWLKFILFAAPFILMLGGLGGLALFIGEALPFNLILKGQAQDRSIIYLPFDDAGAFTYKALNLQERAPEIVVLGSSRSQQYRAEMFNTQPEAFYNAGLTATNVLDMQTLFAYVRRDESAPKILILMLDQTNFYESAYLQNLNRPIQWDSLVTQRLLVGTANTSVSLLTGEYSFFDLPPQAVTIPRLLARQDPVNGGTALGLTAILYGAGYRYDGSRQLGTAVTSNITARFQQHQQALEAGLYMFYPSDDFSPTNIRIVETMLQEAQSAGITVIGVFPSYAPSFAARMLASGKYGYIADSAAYLTTLFQAYEGYFFDFTDARLLASSDAEFYDAYHPAELLTLRMHLALAEALPDLFTPYVDKTALEQLIETNLNPLAVFPEPQ